MWSFWSSFSLRGVLDALAFFLLYYVTGLEYFQSGMLTPAFGVQLDDTLPTGLAFSPLLLPWVQMNTSVLWFLQRSELL